VDTKLLLSYTIKEGRNVPCPLCAITTVILWPQTSRIADIAGASSPFGDGSRWCVDSKIGNYKE